MLGLLALAVAAAALAAPAPAAKPRCKPPSGAKVVRQNRDAAVYRRADGDVRYGVEEMRLWGCWSRTGRLRLLDHTQRDIGGMFVGDIRLAGTYVAWVHVNYNQYDSWVNIRFVNLRRPAVGHTVVVRDGYNGPVTTAKGGDAVLRMLRPTRFGAIAFSEELYHWQSGQYLRALHVWDRGTVTQVGRSTGVDPYSFRWNGRSISWLDGGARRSHTLGS